MDIEFVRHFTAAWSDVQEKAKAIRDGGYVRVISASPQYLVGEVRGDTNIYQTSLMREPGSQRIAMWDCGCAWAAYSWGRSGRWKKFEGRVCAHALALNYEGQSRGWGGQVVQEDESFPLWQSDPSITVKVPGDYKKPEISPWRLDASKTAVRGIDTCKFCGSGELFDAAFDEEGFAVTHPDDVDAGEWMTVCSDCGEFQNPPKKPRRASTDPSLREAPAVTVAREMLAQGASESAVLAAFQAAGVFNAPSVINKLRGAPKMAGQKMAADESVVMREWLNLRMKYPDLQYWSLEIGKTSQGRAAGSTNFKDENVVIAPWAIEQMSEADLIDLVRHEIAHVLAGPSAGHGSEWKHWCLEVGARPDREYDGTDSIDPGYKWVAECPQCEKNQGGWFRKPSNQFECMTCGTPINVVKAASVHKTAKDLGNGVLLLEYHNQFVVVDNGVRAGQITWETKQDQRAFDDEGWEDALGDSNGYYLEVDALFVDPEFRRKGYGTILLDAFREMAERGVGRKGWSPGDFTSDGAAFWRSYSGEAVPTTRRINETRMFESKLAAADSVDGVMIALRPPDHLLDLVHIEGGEPHGDLHLTVAYLGKADEVNHEDLEAAVATWASRWGELPGQLAGYGVFENGDSPVLYVAVDAPGLDRARDDLIDLLAEAGIALPDEHGFDPHITLQYGDFDTPESMPDGATEEFTFGSAYVVYGQEWIEFELGGGSQVEAELKDEPEPALPETTAEEESLAVEPGEGDDSRAWILSDSKTKGGDDMNIAAAARAHLALAKTAVKTFSVAEQQELIDEGQDVVAANLDRLDIEGTHYESLEAAHLMEEDEDWLW